MHAGDRGELRSAASWRGFSLASWTGDGLSFAVVADTDPAEVQRFAERMLGSPP
jgi:anti-sigma factor RsiW